jgi:2-aminoethylphosphonate-pyruvate transaminase
MAERTILLNPGPVTLTSRVRAALCRGDWCHREPEFSELTQDINGRLTKVYPEMENAFDAVMLTGSGTASVEAMLNTFAPRDTGTLVLANGVYGERMASMLAAQRKPHTLVKAPWLEMMDLAQLRKTLDQQDGITHIAAVHHETTTGRLNDLDSLGQICRERDLQLLLDSVSGFGAESIEPDAWNLSALAGTANKCLHGVPGISFVLARKALWNGTRSQSGSVYLDLTRYYRSQHAEGDSPFTQAVQIVFALQEALIELDEQGGWQARGQTYRRRAEAIADCLHDLGVTTLLPREQFSSVLWSYVLPNGWTYAGLHDALKKDGFVIYAGQGDLSSRIFRIAHMGDITDEDLERLRRSLEACFSRAAR